MDFQSAYVIASEQNMLMVLENGGKETVINPETEEIPEELKKRTGWSVRYNKQSA